MSGCEITGRLCTELMNLTRLCPHYEDEFGSMEPVSPTRKAYSYITIYRKMIKLMLANTRCSRGTFINFYGNSRNLIYIIGVIHDLCIQRKGDQDVGIQKGRMSKLAQNVFN